MKAMVLAESVREAGEALGAILSSNVASEDTLVLAFGSAAENAEAIAEYGVKVYRAMTHNPEQAFHAARTLYEKIKPSVVLGLSVKNVKDVASRLAGLYDLPMTTEVWEVKFGDGEVIYKRGVLSERAYSIEKVGYPVIILLNPRVAEPPARRGGGVVEDLELPEPVMKRVELKKKELSGVNLEESEVVVGVGRGFKSRDDLKLAFELAELLGGQVGGSRPIAADLKWLPEDAWIGISGKRISPKLYIAIGISGAPQHMSGVMGSKVIVAINKDKTAPIFKQADYGVVADLYKFLPVLISKIREKSGKT